VFVESVSDGIYCVGADGDRLDVNAAGRRMLAYPCEELLAPNIRGFIASEGLSRVAPEIARVHAGEVVHSEWIFRITRATAGLRHRPRSLVK
jgi:PAS domain S-box-containing protein